MSPTRARIATAAPVAALLIVLSGPAGAQQAAPQTPAPTATPRQPATAQARAAYDRSDALSRQVFWTDQAEINPMDPEAGVKAAQALRELGRFDQAAEMAQRVLLVQPANIDAMLESGRAHIARGQAFYGIADLEKARDSRPNDWRSWSLLGTAYEQVRRPDDARAAWAQALMSWAKAMTRSFSSSTTSTMAREPHSLATFSPVPKRTSGDGSGSRPLWGRFAASVSIRVL